MKILITCPPMLGSIDHFEELFKKYEITPTLPEVIQTLTVEELVQILPAHDGWIIGDDPAVRQVFEAGRSGRLRAVVKWGVGTDNVDIEACKDLEIPFSNTPNMFGAEVADIALGYLIGLARHTFQIDREIRLGGWPKPSGISLSGKVVALIGFGDIGQNVYKRLSVLGMHTIIYDPAFLGGNGHFPGAEFRSWPEKVQKADFIVITCALTKNTKAMINADIFKVLKKGARVVNVSRGAIVDESALEDALKLGIVAGAALDVFEIEPLPLSSYLRHHPYCIFGSHNSSNTLDAVIRTSNLAIEKIVTFLSEK